MEALHKGDQLVTRRAPSKHAIKRSFEHFRYNRRSSASPVLPIVINIDMARYCSESSGTSNYAESETSGAALETQEIGRAHV